MNQTWENDKKPNFNPNFSSFGPNVDSQKFFRNFYLYCMLDLFASYHCLQIQGKLMIQTQENGVKSHFGPNLGPLSPNSGHQTFFSKIWLCQSLDIVASYHHVQYQEKLIIQSWENLVTDDRRTERREWFHRTLSH